jgi:protein-S-isoprenylcysteine O-methyltransferase Ste14
MATSLTGRLIRTIITLPGTVLVLVPAAILWVTAGTPWAGSLAGPADPELWIALVLLLPGLGLAAWTSRLFITIGEGTPAPWDPPQKLVVRGPYRFVRNPMITSVLIMLMAEAVFFASWPILGWMAVFWLVNAVYFPLFEEKGLEKRFGEDYRRYKANVPRWIPRLSPWDPTG